MAAFKILRISLIVLCLLIASLQGHAFSLAEDAIETDSLRITLGENNSGYIQGKVCDYCPLLTVAITPETKAFRGGAEVSLKQAASRLGKPATVFINIEHTRVTRITW